jgi:serine/threonine-protein kinase HSL1 (negative regulator of Swe1 kinase)
LNIKPVSVLVETFSVVQRGHAGHICVARVSQEQGAKSSFERVVDTLSDWLRCREMLILDKKKIKEMRQCLEEWEAT